ncbi:MAG: NAD-dependent epimerase/dehydratase family protein [Planctomycetota bacterium]
MSGLDLVTGGAGYLGSHVARALLARGRRVRVLDLTRTAACPEQAELIEGDMQRPEVVRAACEGVERVLHIAFVQSLSRRPEAERRAINLGGMDHLLAESVRAGVARFVFASTIEVYGTRPPYPCREDAPLDRPVGWYGEHKLRCEEKLWRCAREQGLSATALRMPTICGRGFYNHRPLLELMDRVLDGRPVAVVGAGETPGDFVHVDDVVQAFLLAAERSEAAGEALNVSAAAEGSQRQVIEAMIAAVGSRSRIVPLPRALLRLLLPLGRLLRVHDLPPEQDGYLFFPNHYGCDKARRLLGYAPRYTVAQAAAALIEGYREDRPRVRERAWSY